MDNPSPNTKSNMKTFTDDRGTIEDLKVGKDWSVTYISFKKGAVRGNHYHKLTVQKDYILSGRVELHTPNTKRILDAGESFEIGNGIVHAYKALEDSEMVSICKGKRIGEDYESDTFKLETPII